MSFIPYAIGVFMLSPLFIWGGLWFAFPGPKPGLSDAPLIASLIVLSVPLVLYHYIAGLAFVANSMAGHAGETRPQFSPARWVQNAMLPLTVILTLMALVFLQSQDKSLLSLLLVALAGAALSLGLFKASGGRGLVDVHARLARGLRSLARLLMASLRRIPLIGWLIVEAERRPRAAAPWIIANLVLANGLAVWMFGFTILVIPAMLAVPLAFYVMIAMAAEGDATR